MVAVLGKSSRLILVRGSNVVDLTPDYGGFTYDGTINAIAISPAEREAVYRIPDKIDYSLSIDSLRWGNADNAPSLVNGDEYEVLMVIGDGTFRSIIQHTAIVAGQGVTVPTDDLIDIALTPDLTGPPHIGLGQTAPTASTAHTIDASGVRLWEVPSSGSNQTVWSEWVRSPADASAINFLVLDPIHGSGAQFTIDGRNANGGGTLSPISVPLNRFNSTGLSQINRPDDWANLEVNYRLGRRSASGGAQHGEVWLLGTSLKE